MADRTIIVRPSGGDYTSVSTALSTEHASYPDITDDNGSGGPGWLYFKIEGDWSAAADTAITAPAFTTSADYRICVYTDAANRASLSWNAGKYRAVSAAYRALRQEVAGYFVYDGLQLHSADGSGSARHVVYHSGGATLHLSNCLIRGDKDEDTYEQHGIFSTGGTVYVWNCGIYGISALGRCITNSIGTIYVYSTTGIGGDRGLNRTSGTAYAKNCYFGGSVSGDYYGTITKTTCASSDATGSAGLQSIPVSTATFVNVSAGTEDYHLAAGSALIGVGTDTSADPPPMDFSTDIDGDAR